jgi:hypothetical protein
MAKITVCIHAVAIMIFMGNVNVVYGAGNLGMGTSQNNREGSEEKSPCPQPIVLFDVAKNVARDTVNCMKIAPQILLYDQNGANRCVQDIALFSLSALLLPMAPPLSCVVAAIPLVKQLVEQISIQPLSHSYSPRIRSSLISSSTRSGAGDNESDGDSYDLGQEENKKDSVKLKDYPWVPTISAAVTVAIGTLLVKRIFGQEEKEEKKEKESIVSEDVDGEEYSS